MDKKINSIFYSGLLLYLILLLLPPKYKIAVYTPTLLGFFGCLYVYLLHY